MTITEKVAYIKGLSEGLGFEKADSAEAKLIKALIDLVDEMALEIEELQEDVCTLADYCEELDEDLGDVEEVLLDEYDDEDELDEDDYYEIECPSCGEVIVFDDSLEPDELVCPACGEKVSDAELCDGDCDSCDNKSE